MKRRKLMMILFLMGLMIISFPHIVQLINNKIQTYEVEKFHQEAAMIPKNERTKKIEAIKKCNEAIFQNEEDLQDPFTDEYDNNHYEDCVETALTGEYLSSLEVPKLDLNIPIYIGATNENLTKGIGQVEGSSLPVGGVNTHTVLAGHRGMGMKAMFRHLENLQIGDSFYIHTLNEKIHYQVYDTKVIMPHETETLRISDGKDLASLLTCHPYPINSHRLVVYGERVQ